MKLSDLACTLDGFYACQVLVCVCVCVSLRENVCAYVCVWVCEHRWTVWAARITQICIPFRLLKNCNLLSHPKSLDATAECLEKLCCKLMPKTKNWLIYFLFSWFRDPLRHLRHLFGAMHSENSLEQISLHDFIVAHIKKKKNRIE